MQYGEDGVGSEKEWTDCGQDKRPGVWYISGDWKATALEAEAGVGRDGRGEWAKVYGRVEEITEVDAARHRQNRKEATGLGKLLLSYTETESLQSHAN